MSHSKKSRKIGLIGTPKTGNKPTVVSDKKRKKSSGNASGARNSVHLANTVQPGKPKQNNDRRLGSKKPISLLAEPKTRVAAKTNSKPKFSSPKEELDFIENDQKFNALLDKQEQNKALTEEESVYVQQLLNRHAVLCDLLGISDEESEDNVEDLPVSDDEDSLLDKLENTDFRNF